MNETYQSINIQMLNLSDSRWGLQNRYVFNMHVTKQQLRSSFILANR